MGKMFLLSRILGYPGTCPGKESNCWHEDFQAGDSDFPNPHKSQACAVTNNNAVYQWINAFAKITEDHVFVFLGTQTIVYSKSTKKNIFCVCDFFQTIINIF